MAELADDMVSIKPGTISAMTGLTDFREGSFMNYRDGTYYLTYAIDDTGSPNYRVGYATATSPTGPWTYRGVILREGRLAGHPRHRPQLDRPGARAPTSGTSPTTASPSLAVTGRTGRPRSTGSTSARTA